MKLRHIKKINNKQKTSYKCNFNKEYCVILYCNRAKGGVKPGAFLSTRLFIMYLNSSLKVINKSIVLCHVCQEINRTLGTQSPSGVILSAAWDDSILLATWWYDRMTTHRDDMNGYVRLPNFD